LRSLILVRCGWDSRTEVAGVVVDHLLRHSLEVVTADCGV
jgi:hypothetical protein